MKYWKKGIMMDKFMSKTKCDRCGYTLEARTMSWFTEDCICMTCSDKETEIRKTLPNHGFDYEGCNYIPKHLPIGDTNIDDMLLGRDDG